MNILKFLGLQKKAAKASTYPHNNILHLWEDDNLMLELLPQENSDFVKAETFRINGFGYEHFDGHGFTGITAIGEKPCRTVEKAINISEVAFILENAGLKRVTQFHMQGVGLLQGEKAPIGFGTSTFAIMCETQNRIVTDIWLTGRTQTEEEKQMLTDALLLLGQKFNFIAVDWYRCEYYNLRERASVDEFVTAM